MFSHAQCERGASNQEHSLHILSAITVLLRARHPREATGLSPAIPKYQFSVRIPVALLRAKLGKLASPWKAWDKSSLVTEQTGIIIAAPVPALPDGRPAEQTIHH